MFKTSDARDIVLMNLCVFALLLICWSVKSSTITFVYLLLSDRVVLRSKEHATVALFLSLPVPSISLDVKKVDSSGIKELPQSQKCAWAITFQQRITAPI